MALPAIVPPLITAGASLLGQYLGGRQQNRNVNKTNRANLKLADLQYKRNMEMANYAYDKDLEMWHLQNEYNSPQSQMQRFEEAGLNKHMIYGQGSPGNATGSPSFQPASYEPPQLDYSQQVNPNALVLDKFIGAGKDYLALQHQKEKLEQDEIATWIANETKHAEVGRMEQQSQIAFWNAKSAMHEARIKEIHENIWKKGISPTDATWLRAGLKAMEVLQIPKKLRSVWEKIPKSILKYLDIPNTIQLQKR